MFEKFTLQQPKNSKSCGAYSLSAIINARLDKYDTETEAEKLYTLIGERQKKLNVGESFKPKDHLSLPSSLVLEAAELGLKAQVILNDSLLPKELKTLLPGETDRIGADKVKNSKDNLETLLKNPGCYLVLVNQGIHWIAVAREGEILSGYDPANKANNDALALSENNLTLFGVENTFSGVLIYFP
ncbi:hypothetical protein A8A01_12530 [Ewingella americana]|uniref:hypothetical protein n=1 Tax=Rahnella victoriana TaxID=1510570 RepID=UPI000BB19FA5|nr:hypothetical protein [Rahnella victoriana]PBI81387.1 hypothetical protein A9993_17400 [Rahnella victoriana]PKB89697.1 hypothetical protein A8A01_12530 [Ewingella americana]